MASMLVQSANCTGCVHSLDFVGQPKEHRFRNNEVSGKSIQEVVHSQWCHGVQRISTRINDRRYKPRRLVYIRRIVMVMVRGRRLLFFVFFFRPTQDDRRSLYNIKPWSAECHGVQGLHTWNGYCLHWSLYTAGIRKSVSVVCREHQHVACAQTQSPRLFAEDRNLANVHCCTYFCSQELPLTEEMPSGPQSFRSTPPKQAPAGLQADAIVHDGGRKSVLTTPVLFTCGDEYCLDNICKMDSGPYCAIASRVAFHQ